MHRSPRLKDTQFQPMDLYTVRAGYDSIELFTDAVNKSSSELLTICSGKNLINLMINDPPAAFSRGHSAMKSSGTVMLDFDIFAYSDQSGKMQVTLKVLFYFSFCWQPYDILIQIHAKYKTAEDRLEWRIFDGCNETNVLLSILENDDFCPGDDPCNFTSTRTCTNKAV